MTGAHDRETVVPALPALTDVLRLANDDLGLHLSAAMLARLSQRAAELLDELGLTIVRDADEAPTAVGADR